MKDAVTSEMSFALAQPRAQSGLKTMSVLPSGADGVRCFMCVAAAEQGAVSAGVGGVAGRALPAL